MVVTSRVTVYRRNIAAQFQSGGQGYRWLDKVKLAMFRGAVREASKVSRTGTLAASHQSGIRGLNQYACVATISNTAEHAEWVHEGTTGPITPESAPYMLVPIAPGSQRRFRAKSVRGQQANRWLDRACQAVAYRNGAI